MRRWLLAAMLLAALGCTEKKAPRVRGTTLAAGTPSALFAPPGGPAAAALVDAGPSNVQGAPPDLLLGSLVLAPVDGGKSVRLGGGVSNLPGSVLFTPDGSSIAFLAGYDVKNAEGELRIARASGGPAETVAPNVTFFAFSPDGKRLAYVADGDLYLRDVAGGKPVRVTTGVLLFQFGPAKSAAASTMFIQRTVRVDGALLEYDVDSGKLAAIARGVERFQISPAGDGLAFVAQGLVDPKDVEPPNPFTDHRKPVDEPGLYLRWGHEKPARLTEAMATELGFSPVAHRLAYLTPPTGKAETGELWVADEHKPEKVAVDVTRFAFGADGSLALLGAWVPRAEVGTLGILPAKGALFEVARSVRQFQVPPPGRELLFLHGVQVGTGYALAFSVRPMAAPKEVKPRQLDTGIAGFAVDADETHLAYKAHCLDAGHSCGLFVADLEKGTAPVQVASHIAGFQFVPGKNELVVVESRFDGKLTGRMLYALGLAPSELPAGKKAPPLVLLDDDMTGDFALAGAGKDEVVYLTAEKGRAGLAKASLANPPAPTVER